MYGLALGVYRYVPVFKIGPLNHPLKENTVNALFPVCEDTAKLWLTVPEKNKTKVTPKLWLPDHKKHQTAPRA